MEINYIGHSTVELVDGGRGARFVVHLPSA
jgi:hypothetical protein